MCIRDSPYLDASSARAIGAVSTFAESADLDVYSAGLNDDCAEVLGAYGVDAGFTAKFPTRLEALQAAASST